MKANQSLWRRYAKDLGFFLTLVTGGLGRSERRLAATRYVLGLLMPGRRKSIEPIAARLQVDPQQLQQFVTDSPWREENIWQTLRRDLIPNFAPLACWIVTETQIKKHGSHLVGVVCEQKAAAGKQARHQAIVELLAGNGEEASPIGGRLYLPESWAEDRLRRQAARVPPEVKYRSKSQIALALIDQALSDGVCHAPILGETSFGDSREFRTALVERNLEFFLQATPTLHKAWSELALGKKYKHGSARPDALLAPTLKELASHFPNDAWSRVRWNTARVGVRSSRLALTEVYLLEDSVESASLGKNAWEKLWLVADWPDDQPQPQRFYLASFQRPITMTRILRLRLGFLPVSEYLQQRERSFGLNHFEGRSWRGFHHHLALSAVAYWFVLICHLRSKKQYWSDAGLDLELDSVIVNEINRVLALPALKNSGR